MTRNAVGIIAKNSLSLGIQLKQNFIHCPPVKECIYGGSRVNGLELDSDARWPSTGKVLILQGNQMRKTQAAHSVAAARFCGHCGNFKA